MTSTQIGVREPARCTPRCVIGAVVILVAALGTRFIGLGGQDLWEDEVYTYIGSTDLLENHLTWSGKRTHPHPPMMYVEAKIARQVLGNSEGALRTPEALWSTAAALLLYVIVGTHVGWGAGFWAALLLVMNPFALEWGRDARMYSAWLALTLVAAGLAGVAVRHASGPARSALDWRWWLLGFAFMALHAYVIFGVTTIAAIGLWLGVVGLIALVRRQGGGLTILAGAALSGAVYLGSWSLTGVGKLLQQFHGRATRPVDDMAGLFLASLGEAAKVLAGYVPMGVAIAVWIACAAGLVVLARKGQWRLALLLVLISVLAWVTFPSAASRQAFAPRYVTVALLLLSVGAGALASWAWSAGQGGWRWAGRAAVAAALGGLIAVWTPAWRQILTLPRVPFRAAIAPITSGAVKGDALITVPEWYTELDAYYPFGDKVTRVLPPPEALWYQAPAGETGELPEPFQADFETVFADKRDPKKPIPAATWLLVVQPLQRDGAGDRLHRIGRLLAAYGLDTPQRLAELEQRAQGATTLTVRLTAEGFDHVVTTVGRTLR